MSLLLDSLRHPRGPRPSGDHAYRTARADAVLATLGYRKKRGPGLARLIALGAIGVAVAGLVAWWLWPKETPRKLQQTSAAPAAPVKPPSVAVPTLARPAPSEQAQARPGAPPPVVRPLPATRPPESAVTREAVKPPPRSPVTATSSAARAGTPPRVDVASKPPALTAAGGADMSSAELFKLSLSHHRAGDFTAAEANYRALLTRNELDPQVHNNLGLLYRDRGLTSEAVREFQRALTINPQYSTARNNLGVVLMGAARLDEAATEFRRVLAQDPRDIDARVNLALVEKAAGRPDQARESLLRALTINPRSAPAHFNIAALYEQSGEAARAVEHYRSFLEHAGAEHAARIPDARARIAGLERPD